MKKYLPSLFLMTMIACISQLDSNSDAAKNLSAYKLEAHSHQFTFDSTALLISHFLAKPELHTLASAYALGGTLPAKQLKLTPTSVGIIFWFCFKGGKKPELFLACEQLDQFDLRNMPTHPSGKTLVRPGYTFSATGELPTDALSVKKFLQTQITQKTEAQLIDNASVIRYINSFDSLMNTIADRNGERYNHYPFSFFVRNHQQEIAKLLDQAGEDGVVNYYFGFDENDKPNRIRVILMTGDAAGRNTIMARQKEEVMILQKSVPPPPITEDGM